MNNTKNYYTVEVTEIKKHVFAISAQCPENAQALVEEAYANGSFNMSDIEPDVFFSTNGTCNSPSERVGKLSLDCNFNVDIYK